jgi:(p)ppGpp synthase/HD superfamily hydrolase
MNNQYCKIKVLDFARQAHAGQKRKYLDKPYITHPIEVSKIVERDGGDLNMQLAALLHDVLEDTSVSWEELRRFLHSNFGVEQAEDVLHLVVQLTDVYTKESFPELNRRARKSMEASRLGLVSLRAKRIKLADIEHNTSSIVEHDPKFAKVFLQEKRELLENMKLNG